MTKQVDIEVLRPFNRTPQGGLADVGEKFAVDETRAQELARLGLAKVRGAKAAPKPQNKMATEPTNKEGIKAAERHEQSAQRSVTVERRAHGAVEGTG